MSEEKRMLGNYEVVNSIYIGDKEVVFGVDKSDKYPFLVSYCDYHNPFGVPWATESVGCDDYLEAMGIFIQRVQSQIEKTKSELSKFAFDNTVFTKDHCIPDKRSSSIVGKVVVINAEPKRYEYQHPAFQLVLADGGNGATGGRGNAVFGTCLATGEKSRWERYDVLGEIKPEYCTGITQNVDDLLQSHTARTMLANSEFIIMLNQASTDRIELAKLLNISDLQMSYITNVGAGQGLLKVGSSLVPFVNKFPRNTELYKLMTTKFGEV